MNKIAAQLLVQIILILLNAFFAMAEIAVISLNGAKVKKLSEEGDKKAAKLLKLVEEPSGFLSTIQIGITLAGFLGSAFAADNFSGYFVKWVYEDLGFTSISVSALDTIAVILITLILSYFTLIFGELVPKRIAMQKSLAAAKISCGTVSAVAFVMKPVVWFLSASTNVVLKVLHMKTEAEEESVTEEEIRLMMELGEEKGTIDSEEKEWIENVFEFGDTTAGDHMTHSSEVTAISFTQSKEEILQVIQKTGLSRFPVYEKNLNDIRGILYARDFLISLNENKEKGLEDMMKPAYFVPETIPSSVLFQDMQKKKIHLAVVVDEYGEVSGIITMEDLLEEIVGNIYDEFDPSEPPEISKTAENLWKCSGAVKLDTIRQELNVEIPDRPDCDTLGGLVFSRLHSIPKDGARFELEVCGIKIHVKEIKGRKIVEAELQKVL
ncbi:hemolysin family protein [Anaerostipes sp.]|uniref:hemolysin family protein n=1 Tax=Anaerostipes sp. TaxID=1872530 RepID=UPI0025BDC231|nr:hemolysin family protein [Anaerostipes sp.]MBS7009087.1 HlyC/CorC family transporter [Anaerostipes sp.]